MHDVGFQQFRYLPVAIDDMLCDCVHHGVRSQFQDRRRLMHLFADLSEASVFAVSNGQHETRPDRDHHLSGLDEMPHVAQAIVVGVVHGLENQHQCVVVAFQFRAVMSLDRPANE
jgi:hypothetical protein